MRRLAVILAVALPAAAAAPAAAKLPPPPKRCSAGVTGFVDGPLRIFGLRWERRGPFGPEWGADHYACLGRGGRPQGVGAEYGNGGTGSDDVPAYALGGSRYLAAYRYTDGEGGASAVLTVRDLRARRGIAFVNMVCCEGIPPFLVGADGTVAAIEPGEGLWIKRPGARTRFVNEDVPHDLAMAGGTVYWREGGQARSTVLPGLSGDAESRMLEPMVLPDRDRRCPSVRGRTVAASGSVRVVQRPAAAVRLGCRAGRRFPAGPSGAPAPRIVNDRWLLVHRAEDVKVLDTRTGEVVTRVRGVPQALTLLYDGTVAWIDSTTMLRVQRRGERPVQLGPGARHLAGARRAVFWTDAAGEPHVYRPAAAPAPAPTAMAAAARVRCGDGTTAFVDGSLRIFGIHYRTSFERGFEEYACLGRRMRPMLVGGVGSDDGVGSAETPLYAHAGRYLAAYSQSDGEGGPGADVTVFDLIRRRTVGFANLACCEWTPAIRLARDGTVAVLSPGEGLFVKSRGRRARTLAPEGAAGELAMHGGTVYWTQGGRPRSATLEGVTGGEATALEPVRLRRRGGPCRAARGRTIAASGSIRVYGTPDGRFQCRVDREGRLPLAGSTAPRIAGDRWVLAFGEGSARVVDSRTGRTVTRALSVSEATLLRDGTLAWIDFARAVRVAAPGATPLVVGEGASRLAAARRAVAWTDATGPRRFPGPRPPAG